MSQMIRLIHQDGEPQRWRFTFDHTDLTETTADTAQTLNIFTCGAGDLVRVERAVLTTAFEDGADAAYNSTAITVGDSGDADRLLASMQLNANGTEIFQQAGVAAEPHYYASGTTVQVTVNSMSTKSLSDLDAGSAYIDLVVYAKADTA